MASSWADSWLTAWADSWGATSGVTGHSGVRRLADAEALEAEQRRRVVYQRQQAALAYNTEALRRQAELTAEMQKASEAVTGKPLAKRLQRKLEKATNPAWFAGSIKLQMERLEKIERDHSSFEAIYRQLGELEAMIAEYQQAQYEALLLDDEEAMIVLAMM